MTENSVLPAEVARGTAPSRLAASAVSLSYGGRLIVDGLSVEIKTGAVTVIIGANACGKSTLLRGLARLLQPVTGTVLLDGEDIRRRPTKEIARTLGMLPQQPTAPEGLTVRDLISRGRHPHQSFFQQWSPADERALLWATSQCDLGELMDTPVDELSGGQRQRAWIAMAIAQETPLLLLDEPTTFLDLAHQIEVMDLVRRLNRTQGRTVVCVLHELNQSCRYADEIIAMKSGRIVAQGPPGEVVTAELVETVFDLETHVIADPLTGTPLVIPVPRPEW